MGRIYVREREMAQLGGTFSEVEISKVHSFWLHVFVRLVRVKGGSDYECVRHEWSKL
jgi:hypothetical protein